MGQYVAVASTDQVPPGQARRVVVKGNPIAVFNTGKEFLAVDDTCSHDEASLAEGELFGEIVECPLHGARFNIRTGKALSLPAVYPVRRYDVKIDGDQIQIEV